MRLHKYLTLTTLLLIVSTPLVSLATGRLAIEKEKNNFSEKRIIAKPNPIVKKKKSKQMQWSCSITGRNWEAINETISVEKKAFTAVSKLQMGNFYGNSYSQTCKFVVNSGNIKFIYALPDNSGLANVKITAYLDGEPVSSIVIAKGETDKLDINTSGFKSIAIEIIASPVDGSYFGNTDLYLVTE